MAHPSGLPLPLAGRRPAYGIYFEAEPRYAKVSGIVVSVLASGACASFFLLLAIYFDSYLFVMASTVLHYSFSLNDYHSLCEAATLLCLLAYLSSKAYLTAVFTYPIYRACDLHITGASPCTDALAGYTVKGSAEISPTAASGGTRTRSERLLRVAKKSFAGCCLTLSSSIANLLALMLLDGEPAWLCLLCCKIDGTSVEFGNTHFIQAIPLSPRDLC
ncbi:hypothetical protein PG985_011013 [Apiospora marii]|uniref:uncharacterized protein n=1 Tax=Apiospora marii TaxID=335849 RepID=UPI00312FED72